MSAPFWLTALARPLLLPPLDLLLLMAAGWLLSRRHPRAGRSLAAFSGAALLFFSTEFGADFLVRPLEKMTAPLPAADRTAAQAIVVLAAGRLESAPEYGDADIPDYIALARLRYAAKLEHETRLPMLVSGGNAPAGEPQNSKAQAMADALRNDFRAPVTWIEGASENTAGNAALSAKILLPTGIYRILLVTDAMHMPRATLAFTRAGFSVVAAPTMFFTARRTEPLAFLPSAEGLRRSYYAAYEWLGLIWYRSRGGRSTKLDT
jgi:uncharacterized SAM-binding protein YcdF (DUF218 family)